MNHKGWLNAIGAMALLILYVVLFFVALLLFDWIFASHLSTFISSTLNANMHFSLLIMIICAFLVIRTIDGKWNYKDTGLHNIAEGKADILFGLLLGALLMGVFLLFNLVFGAVQVHAVSLDYVELGWMFLLFVLVAFNEEILIRGIFQRYLRQSFNAPLSLIIASFVFALMHLANPNVSVVGFVHLIVAGVVLGGVYFITKNLWFSIAYHFSWNFFQSLAGLNVSGKSQYSLIELGIGDSYLMNGGAFGAEGSLFMLVFQLFSLALIWYFYKRKGFAVKRSLLNR